MANIERSQEESKCASQRQSDDGWFSMPDETLAKCHRANGDRSESQYRVKNIII